MNLVILAGNLGRDPELRYAKDGGLAICKLSVATDNFVKGGVEALWTTVTMFGASAENANKVLAKGNSLTIFGHLQKRSWQDESGKNVSMLEIIGDRWKKMGGGSSGNNDSDDTEEVEDDDNVPSANVYDF